MNAKKLLALLLALCCVGTLAACESTPAETTAPAAETTAPAAETTAPAAETTAPAQETTEAAPLTNAERYPIDFDGTLTAVTTLSTGDTAHHHLMWEELTGVDIDWQIMTSDQVPLLFVGDQKQIPDILWNTGGISVEQMNEYGQAGLLVNFLDPEILDKMPNLKAAYEADPKLFDICKTADGAAYTLPRFTSTLTAPGNLFYVRTDMTKEAGIEELPSTVEGFLEMCETLKTYYADVEGYVPMVTNGGGGVEYNGAYASFFFPAFGELMETGITVTMDGQAIAAGFATEQFKHYLTFMHTCWEKGYLDPNSYSVESNTDKARIIDKTATMNPYATYLGPTNFASGEMDFQVMPPLTSEYTSEALWLIPVAYKTTKNAISTNCENIDAACAFFDAAYSTQDNPIKDDGEVSAWGVSLWLGEHGEDWILDEENGSYEVLPHEGYENASTWLNSAGANGLYYEWPYYENSGTGLMVKAIGTRDILMPHGVSVLSYKVLNLTQDEQDIYNDSWIEIENKVTEMTAAFITGQADLEKDWDTYVNDLNKMGLQDVIDVYQAALDRYNAR